jgi:hypothetical protein
LALVAAAPVSAQRPAWAELEGMALGGPIDAVFSLGLNCRPGSAFDGSVSGVALTTILFGNSFAHSHYRADAARRALDSVTVCRGPIWPDSALVLVLGIARRIGAITVLYDYSPNRGMAADSVRRRVRRRWGRGVGTDALEEWGEGRYRAYLLNVDNRDRTQRRLTLLDARACTAFDRLLHQVGEPGRAVPC